MSTKIFQWAFLLAVTMAVLTATQRVALADALTTCGEDMAVCKKSCAAGSDASCTELAERYFTGVGLPADRFRARELLSKSCDAKHGPACLALAKSYRARFLIDFDDASARAAVVRAETLLGPECQGGDDQACHSLAGLQADRYQGTHAEEDLSGARKLLQRLCGKAKRIDSCALLVDLYPMSIRDCPPLPDGRNESVSCVQIRIQTQSARQMAARTFLNKCLKKDAMACLHLAELKAVTGAYGEIEGWKQISQRAANERACEGGEGLGCLRVGTEVQREPGADALAIEWFKKGCKLNNGRACQLVAQSLSSNDKDQEALAEATSWRKQACNNGHLAACRILASSSLTNLNKNFTDQGRDRAIKASARTCAMTELSSGCVELCDLAPGHPECLAREQWLAHRNCLAGDDESCDRVAQAHLNGNSSDGGAQDSFVAAMALRQGCSSASAGSCMRLRKLCAKETSLSSEACERSLIDSDLFYEAEQQFRTSGKATLMSEVSLTTDPGAKVALESPSKAENSGQRRGTLDADLVADVVLSRARQAALRLVVSELRRAMGRRQVPLYMRDLLGQAALLLADPDTMRREKVEDLAMTVVRAFVSSTLVRTLYPGDDALATAPRWAQGFAWPEGEGPAIRRYLVDLAYRRLGDTRVFERRGGDTERKPDCPKGLTALCDWLDGETRQRLETALHVDDMLTGLRLVKQIKLHGSLDFRRLIEALGRSTSIASFDGTAGLRIESWRREIIVDIKSHLEFLDFCMFGFRGLREQVSKFVEAKEGERRALAKEIVKSQSFTTVRYVLGLPAADLLFGHQAVESLAQLIRALEEGNVEEAEGIASFSLLWSEADARSKAVVAKIPDARKAVIALESAVDTLEQTLQGFRLEAGKRDIGSLSLHTIPVLRNRLALVLSALDGIDAPLRIVDGQWDGAKPFFAQRAIMRLLGLLDLVEKTASVVSLDESIEEVLTRLRRLGSTQGDRFEAPLLDVLEPILGALDSHRSLNADLLFQVISRARLDSLLASLTGSDHNSPCRNENSSDCWTLKVLHSLQESIERDGETIRVDGDTFARRLAGHGDSFRRRHRGGFFFHLTVGMGGLYSVAPPATDPDSALTDARADDRWAPLISEQVGFGFASPTFAGDSLTAKFGLAASGVLYRMLLDSTESNAVMLAPFAALDVYDLVELYVAPGLWLYPPSGDSSLATNFGVSVGLQVPLGAYLERIGK